MLQRLLPVVVKLRQISPRTYSLLVRIARRFLGNALGVYPKIMGREVEAVTEVLRGSQWNMAYGQGLVHERLEAEFAESIGVGHAVAVASGGVAIQMSLRALRMRHGDEVIHQVDTCSATAMAVMNAGVTPIFADISGETFMLNLEQVSARVVKATRAVLATHMWGNPENMAALRRLADDRGIRLVEDACLGLGAVASGRKAGAWGDVGVFSFGCVKPIQTGEGGMIVTADEALARELRSLRHWGDRTTEYGVRDATSLAWNGRMSEILAALAREQLKGYPAHLSIMREAVAGFHEYLTGRPGLSLVLGHDNKIENAAFTQVVFRFDEKVVGMSKRVFMDKLEAQGVPVWHANFEPITHLSLFKTGAWRDWIVRGDLDRVESNYNDEFVNAEYVFRSGGLGIAKTNFLSAGNLNHLRRAFDTILAKRVK